MTLIPTVVDSGPRGDRAFDIFSLLVKERIVFLGQEVDDQIANLLVAEILYLESQDPDADIPMPTQIVDTSQRTCCITS